MSHNSNIKSELLVGLRDQLGDTRAGLPEEVFLFVSSLTPLVNVDLLVQSSINGAVKTLLTWRDDAFYQGWHLPGGILRFKESFQNRIHKVAENELGRSAIHISQVLEINEKVNHTRDVRGHFISLLFRVELDEDPPESNRHKRLEAPVNGVWDWHSLPPRDLLEQHNVYKKYF